MNTYNTREEKARHFYKPEYCMLLAMHGAEGYTFGSFAAKIGVPATLVDMWLDIFEDFADAREVAESMSRYHWEQLLTQNSGQHSHKSTVNVPLVRWVLASRWPDDWKPRLSHPKSKKDADDSLNPPPPLTDAERAETARLYSSLRELIAERESRAADTVGLYNGGDRVMDQHHSYSMSRVSKPQRTHTSAVHTPSTHSRDKYGRK